MFIVTWVMEEGGRLGLSHAVIMKNQFDYEGSLLMEDNVPFC